jgi:hypothetical protein
MGTTHTHTHTHIYIYASLKGSIFRTIPYPHSSKTTKTQYESENLQSLFLFCV